MWVEKKEISCDGSVPLKLTLLGDFIKNVQPETED